MASRTCVMKVGLPVPKVGGDGTREMFDPVPQVCPVAALRRAPGRAKRGRVNYQVAHLRLDSGLD